MRFDCTKEKSAKYVVILYGWNIEDRYYFHYFKEAKDRFELLKANLKGEQIASIYDLEKDERKAFARG